MSTTNKQTELFPTRFDDRFFKDHAGKIITDPKIAIIELIANAWDAFATKVSIKWPNTQTQQAFSIEDNGCGMSASEFEKCWLTVSYNRRKALNGAFAEVPVSLKDIPNLIPRHVFGKNGKGRHAGFCFSDQQFFVETKKDGKATKFSVSIPITGNSPFKADKVSELDCSDSGTRIYSPVFVNCQINAAEIRSEIGMRFLSDPSFSVFVDDIPVTFSDIPKENIQKFEVNIEDVGKIEIIMIDTLKSDDTTKQHGIAWQIKNRRLGNIGWDGINEKKFLDGRKTAAKRYCFIVKADCLEPFVLDDWSDFNQEEIKVQNSINAVYNKIKEILFDLGKEEREETYENIRKKNQSSIKTMGLVNLSVWSGFVKKVQEECPNISEADLERTSTILATLEAARSKYNLLEKLGNCSAEDFDQLNSILASWSIETAKIVLDELETRLRLIDQLSKKVLDNRTEEVQELQPLFEKGLWIFGPEFESIAFSSNQTMATIIQEIFKRNDILGSKNRPDFLITPTSSLGFYSHPQYDDENSSEIGYSRLVIIELKKPGIAINTEEKNQCWKYIKELLNKGIVSKSTKINAYVLGKTISQGENEPMTQGDNVTISPFTYSVILERAKSRTHRLYEKIRSAPFIKNSEIQNLMDIRAAEPTQEMFFEEGVH